MLPVLYRHHSQPKRRTLLALALIAGALCAIPTVWNAPLLADPPEPTLISVVTEEPVEAKVEVEIELKDLANKIAVQTDKAAQQKAHADKTAQELKTQYDVFATKSKPLNEDRLSKLESQLQELLKEVKSLKGDGGKTVQYGSIYTHPTKPAAAVEATKPAQPAKTVASSRAAAVVASPAGVMHVQANPHVLQKQPSQPQSNLPGLSFGVGHNMVGWQLSATSGDGKTIVLSRATYKLSHDKAVALETFLKEHVKSDVLEMKVEGDTLTVTSAPEQQVAIQQLIHLMQPVESKTPLRMRIKEKSDSSDEKPALQKN